jgi:citrate synthase
MSDSVKLTYQNKTFEFPIVEGTENEKGIDIKSLRAQTGLITFDPGFKNTGSCKSGITFLNGEEGILRYRGYSIEELCEKTSFIEVAFLLIFGELPSKDELELFNDEIRKDSLVDEDLKSILKSFPKSAHPMGHRKGKGLPLNYANTALSYVENLAHMMFKLPHQDFKPSDVLVSALNKLLILHADHEQNCSTSTVRIVGSSHAGLFASVSAGISALWGPLHGGANQAVIEMLEAIQADGGDTQKFMAKAKDKNDPFRLMGFGHRVYKNFDPRARIIKKAADEVLDELGINDPILQIAKNLEQEALKDPYFIDRKLYPNVDFYSGIIYRALGIPTEMFTVMFALGRLPGWIAQWLEMRKNNEPIGRPRQIYTGKNDRKV